MALELLWYFTALIKYYKMLCDKGKEPTATRVNVGCVTDIYAMRELEVRIVHM